MVFDSEVDEGNPLRMEGPMIGGACPVLHALHLRLVMTETEDHWRAPLDRLQNREELRIVIRAGGEEEGITSGHHIQVHI